jgi:hypothetical protein
LLFKLPKFSPIPNGSFGLAVGAFEFLATVFPTAGLGRLAGEILTLPSGVVFDVGLLALAGDFADVLLAVDLVPPDAGALAALVVGCLGLGPWLLAFGVAAFWKGAAGSAFGLPPAAGRAFCAPPAAGRAFFAACPAGGVFFSVGPDGFTAVF